MLENAGKIDNFSFTYEKVNKTDSLQPSGCNGPLVCINRRSVFCLLIKGTPSSLLSHTAASWLVFIKTDIFYIELFRIQYWKCIDVVSVCMSDTDVL